MATTPESEDHRLNYRMAFDAMRAYHSSEIEHKKDMIAILNGILVAIVTVYAGVFIFILKEDVTPYYGIFYLIILVITLLFYVLIKELKSSNKEKIEADNDRYEKFRRECEAEREHLGLKAFFDLSYPDSEIYWKEPSGKARKGSGYLKTIDIINIYSNVLIGITICLTTICFMMLYQKQPPPKAKLAYTSSPKIALINACPTLYKVQAFFSAKNS